MTWFINISFFPMITGVEEVMTILKEEANDLKTITKESSLPRRFFKEIQRKSLLKHSSGNDMHAVKQLVQDYMTADEVLVYKFESEAFGVTEELSKDVFMLGLQSQQMLQILKTYGQVIFVEGLHTLSHYPDYRLFNFLVSDDERTVFPVAHFITNSMTAEHLTLMFASLRPRVEHLSVESLVVQSGQYLEVALAPVFNHKTIYINQWSFCSFGEWRKNKGSVKSFDYIVVDNKGVFFECFV